MIEAKIPPLQGNHHHRFSLFLNNEIEHLTPSERVVNI